MKYSKFYLLMIIAVLAFLAAACGNEESSADNNDTEASDYPNKQIDIMIPYASGGGADVMVRTIAPFMEEELGQSVNVIEKPGGAGAVGMNSLKSANPDGYSLIYTAVGPSTLTPNYQDVGYNTPEDFKAVSQFVNSPYAIAVNSNSGIETLAELMDYSKDHHVTFGTTGAGLHQHIVMEDLLTQMDDEVEMDHVPFDGGSEAVTALLGEHTTASVNVLGELMPHYEDGTINLLAVTTDERIDEIPDVPTLKELGFDPLGTGAWFGFVAPKDTPDEIVEKLDDMFKKMSEDEELQVKLEDINYPIEYINHDDLSDKIKKDFEQNADVIQNLNLGN